jgi:hypothetical protein
MSESFRNVDSMKGEGGHNDEGLMMQRKRPEVDPISHNPGVFDIGIGQLRYDNTDPTGHPTPNRKSRRMAFKSLPVESRLCQSQSR